MLDMNSKVEMKSSSNCPEYETYFNKAALKRQISPLRPVAVNPKAENISLAGGFPHPSMFPILETEITLIDGTKLKIGPDEMKVAQQYGVTNGITELLEWLTEWVRRIHNPPTLDQAAHPGKLDVIVLAGSQGGVCACFNILLNEGDTVLVQNPSYPTMFSMVEPLGCQVVGVESDINGIIPSKMRSLLEDWEENNPLNRKAPRPRVFYCVPTGENPRSTSWSDECRREVYQICRDFDMLIMEDDPYYLTCFTRPLPQSLLSLDVDGRVVRFDSFSKVVSPGMRLGYMSGPQALIDKMVTIYHTSTVSASQYNQVTLLTILKHWGYEGFLKQGLRISRILKQQAEYMIEAANIHLTDVADWVVPTAGMFLWVRLKHVPDTRPVVQKCNARGLLIVNGASAIPQYTVSPYLRISFSMVSKEYMLKAFQILAEVVREDQKKGKSMN